VVPVTAAITGFASVTCLGNADDAFAALCRGETGVAPLRDGDPERLNVRYAYEVPESGARRPDRVERWLRACLTDAVRSAGIDPRRSRIAVIVGTGLRELRRVESWWTDGTTCRSEDLDFGASVREVLPEAVEVVTISNACSASGYALAVAEDLLALDEADVVIAVGCDSTTESMLAMVGRVGAVPSDALRPFDRYRRGTLLGEGAAAVVLESAAGAAERGAPVRAWLRAVGLSTDAHHETAPSVAGIAAAMRDAHARAGIEADQVDLVIVHGTGTALNDPAESAALKEVFVAADQPLVTAVKGGLGHTSGGSALMSVIVAIQAMGIGRVPAVVGLRDPIEEVRGLRLVVGETQAACPRISQVNAFGFGGVNAVAIVERAAC
jgi:3-oxoacyl-[acyl-carrier-protein] synthase II